jgi:hypothetical protein
MSLDLAKYEYNRQQAMLEHIAKKSEDWTLNECKRVIAKAEQMLAELEVAQGLHTLLHLFRDNISNCNEIVQMRIKCANERIDELTKDAEEDSL